MPCPALQRLESCSGTRIVTVGRPRRAMAPPGSGFYPPKTLHRTKLPGPKRISRKQPDRTLNTSPATVRNAPRPRRLVGRRGRTDHYHRRVAADQLPARSPCGHRHRKPRAAFSSLVADLQPLHESSEEAFLTRLRLRGAAGILQAASVASGRVAGVGVAARSVRSRFILHGVVQRCVLSGDMAEGISASITEALFD